MINDVITLFKIFIEIILFRKGPADVPHSIPLLVVVSIYWCFIALLSPIVLDGGRQENFLFDLAIASVGLIIYMFIVNFFGYRERIICFLTTILGCSVIFSLILSLIEFALSSILSGDNLRLILLVIWLWSIPVEGHIVAQTIDRQWVFGFLITITVSILQLQFLSFLKPIF
jgi:hypothetical protein